MKLETKKQIDFTSNASFEGFDAQISSEDIGKLWDMLQNPYRNPIGAVVREYVSNSQDAHSEALRIKNCSIEEIRNEFSIYKSVPTEEIEELKKRMLLFNNEPVVVAIEKDDTGWYWSTEDVGVGLSPERVRTVFVNYLKSTKELSNSVIGAFGIGSKSGLSYSDVVFIRSRYNGIEHNYMLRKGESGPRLDIIGEEATTERNGTTIKIYFNESTDKYRFQNECKQQLAYFDNIYYKGECDIPNTFNIIKGDEWLATTNSVPHYNLHLCLGKVSYPIDWKALETPVIDLPIALRFEVGELDVIQTREDVKYTPRTKEVLLNKIELLRQELQKRWDDKDKRCSSILEYYQKRNDACVLQFDSLSININAFLGIKDNGYYYEPFQKAGIKNSQLPTFRDSLFLEYYFAGWFKLRYKGLHDSITVYQLQRHDLNIYRIIQEHDTKKSKYLLSEVHTGYNQSLRFVRKRKKTTLKQYIDVLTLKTVHKSEWRKQITVFQKEMQKLMVSLTKSYDKVVVPQEYLDSLKKNRKQKDNTEIKVDSYSINLHSNSTKSTDKLKISNLEKDGRSLFVVGSSSSDDFDKIRAIALCYNVFTTIPSKQLKLYEIAPTNIKKLKLKNMQTVDSFKSENNTVFKKVMSFIKVYKEHKKTLGLLLNDRFSARNGEVFKSLSSNTNNILNKNKQLLLDGRRLINAEYPNKNVSDFLRIECYSVAETFDLFDKQFEKELLNIINTYNKYDFLLKLCPTGDTEVVTDYVMRYIYLHNLHCSKQDRIPLDINNVIYMKSLYPKKSNKQVVNKQEYLLPV